MQYMDVTEKDFTLKDLKDGMVGVTREGEYYIWLQGIFRNADGYSYLHNDYLKMDLTCGGYANCDIMRIYHSSALSLNTWFDTENLTLLWERKEIVKMTLSEISRKLGISGSLQIKEEN